MVFDQQVSVAILLPCALTGGTEVATLETALALKGLGVKVSVIVYFNEVDPVMLRCFERAGIHPTLLGRKRENNLGEMIGLLYSLARVLARSKYDLIWVQYMTPTLLPLLIARPLANSLVAGIHVSSTHFDRSALRRLRWLVRHWVTRTVCVSHSTARGLFGADTENERVFVIPNCLNMHAVHSAAPRSWREEADWPQEVVVVGYIGRLSAIKGPDILLRAAALLTRRFQHVRMVYVGDGIERGELKTKAVELGISEFVHFAGRLAPDAAYSAIKGFDILAVPSSEEGFGLSALEGMAAGVPVVASQIDALQELIEHGVTGFLFERGDVEGLADALATLVQDVALRGIMGAAGMERVTVAYDKSLQEARLADLLSQMKMSTRRIQSRRIPG